MPENLPLSRLAPGSEDEVGLQVCNHRVGHDGQCSSYQAVNSHRLLPTLSWEPMQIGFS